MGSGFKMEENFRYGHCTVWYGMVRYGTVWYGMVRYGKIYGMVRYGKSDPNRPKPTQTDPTQPTTNPLKSFIVQ